MTRVRDRFCKTGVVSKCQFESVLVSRRAQPIDQTTQLRVEGQPKLVAQIPLDERSEHDFVDVRRSDG